MEAAVISIELYELLIDRNELYKEPNEGIESLEKGKVYSEKEVCEELEKV